MGKKVFLISVWESVLELIECLEQCGKEDEERKRREAGVRTGFLYSTEGSRSFLDGLSPFREMDEAVRCLALVRYLQAILVSSLPIKSLRLFESPVYMRIERD